MPNIPRRPLLFFAVLLVGCSEPAPPPSDAPAVTVTEVAPEPPAPGEFAMIRLSGDTVLHGVAMTVRRSDDTEVRALFRGPVKLAEMWSGGDFSAHEDSLHVRVHMLAEGERLEKDDREIKGSLGVARNVGGPNT